MSKLLVVDEEMLTRFSFSSIFNYIFVYLTFLSSKQEKLIFIGWGVVLFTSIVGIISSFYCLSKNVSVFKNLFSVFVHLSVGLCVIIFLITSLI